jgi:hypothetical protein
MIVKNKKEVMRLVLSLIIIAFCLCSCKKSAPVFPGLFGKWELRNVSGGLSYRDSIYKPGNGNIFQLYSDSTYKHFSKNKLDQQSSFHIKKSIFPSGVSVDEVMFENYLDEQMVVTGTKMTLGTTAADGIAQDYQKISN